MPDIEAVQPTVERTWPVFSRVDAVGIGRAAAQLTRALGWSITSADVLALVIAELAGNASRHGGGGRCTLRLSPSSAVVRVEDDGPGFPGWVLDRMASGGRVEPPGPEQARVGLGAGLDGVRRLAAQVRCWNHAGARVEATVHPGQRPVRF